MIAARDAGQLLLQPMKQIDTYEQTDAELTKFSRCLLIDNRDKLSSGYCLIHLTSVLSFVSNDSKLINKEVSTCKQTKSSR